MVTSMRAKLRWVYTREEGPSDENDYHSLLTGGDYYAWGENLCRIHGTFSDIYYPETVAENVLNWNDPKFKDPKFKDIWLDDFIFKVSDGHIYHKCSEFENWLTSDEYIEEVYHHLLIQINHAERVLFEEVPPSVQSCIRLRDEVDTPWFGGKPEITPTGIIYEAHHRRTDKRYFGKTTKDFYIRVQQHYRESSRGGTTKFNTALREAPNDFVWRVCEEGIPLDKLGQRERYWISHHDSYRNGYNSTSGG